MIRLRLVGTPEVVDLALARLRQSFSQVTAGDAYQLKSNPGLVRVFAVCRF
jgi:hypothetical protein